MKRVSAFLAILAIGIMLAALFVPSAFCFADTQEDVVRVQQIVVQLSEVGQSSEQNPYPYLTADVFWLISEADTLLAKPEVKAQVAQSVLDDYTTYRTCYVREDCLKELDDREGGDLQEGGGYFLFEGGAIRYYYDFQWSEIQTWVQAYRNGAPTWDAATLQSRLSELFAAVDAVPDKNQIDSAWAERVNNVVRAQNDALFDKVDELRLQLGLPLSRRVSFYVGSNDSIAQLEQYVATYLVDYERLSDVWRQALAASQATDKDCTEADIYVYWQEFGQAVAAIDGIVVSGDDVAVSIAKENLIAFIQNALATEPLVSLTGADRQYYLDLAANCQVALDDAQTLAKVQEIDDYYRPRFVFASTKKKDNTQWIIMGVSLGVALICFVVYFVMKRRDPAPKKKKTKKSAEQMMAELLALAQQQKENVSSAEEQNGEHTQDTATTAADAAEPQATDRSPMSAEDTPPEEDPYE